MPATLKPVPDAFRDLVEYQESIYSQTRKPYRNRSQGHLTQQSHERSFRCYRCIDAAQD